MIQYNVRRHGDMYVFELESRPMSAEDDAKFVYDKIQEWYEQHAPENSVLRNNRTYWDQHPTVLAKNAYMYAATAFRKKVKQESEIAGPELNPA